MWNFGVPTRLIIQVQDKAASGFLGRQILQAKDCLRIRNVGNPVAAKIAYESENVGNPVAAKYIPRYHLGRFELPKLARISQVCSGLCMNGFGILEQADPSGRFL